MRRLAPLLRHPLGEQRHDVGAVRTQRLVEGGGNDAVAEGALRRPALPGVLEGPLHVLDGRGHLHRAGVVLGHRGAGVGGEVGQLGQGQVDLDHAAPGLPPLDVLDEVVGQLGGAQVVEEGRPGMEGGHHQRGHDLLAALEHDARGPGPGPPGCGLPGASVRISAPKLRADRSMASATAPMPPSGKPQLPRWPSPMSPMEWWAIT